MTGGTDAPERERPARRYMTLEAARALDCNGCGDCCNSSRTEGFWTWGSLPAGQYAALNHGEPLIIPVELASGGWRDRAWRDTDATAATSTPFRCDAFRPQP